jgi:hypothetical protein
VCRRFGCHDGLCAYDADPAAWHEVERIEEWAKTKRPSASSYVRDHCLRTSFTDTDVDRSFQEASEAAKKDGIRYGRFRVTDCPASYIPHFHVLHFVALENPTRDDEIGSGGWRCQLCQRRR